MRETLKRMVSSKLLRIVFSVALIFFAFRRVDVVSLLKELSLVPWWFVVVMLCYNALIMVIGAYRWSLLLFPSPGLKEVLDFSRSQFLGGFYGLFFPTGMAGDVFKWMPLIEKYPQIGKGRLVGSVLMDRIVGFSAFIFVAFAAALLGTATGFRFPPVLLLLFGGLFAGTVVFYGLVYSVDLKKLITSIPYINKLGHIIDLIKQEDKMRIIKCIGVAFVTEFMWITSIWFISLAFQAGFSLLAVYIFMPIISLILLLPISVAGFGARETLFLVFFSQTGIPDDKILVVSAFNGILGILGALLGGIVNFF